MEPEGHRIPLDDRPVAQLLRGRKGGVPFSKALETAKDESKRDPLIDILQHASGESPEFYMDAAKILAVSLEKIETQIAKQENSFNDVSAVVSNKASIVNRIVALVEKYREKKKAAGATPTEVVVKNTLDKVQEIFREMDVPGEIKDKFFLQLSSRFAEDKK